jgi:hypothetical protein
VLIGAMLPFCAVAPRDNLPLRFAGPVPLGTSYRPGFVKIGKPRVGLTGSADLSPGRNKPRGLPLSIKDCAAGEWLM